MTALVLPPGMQQAVEADAEQGMLAPLRGKQPDALTPREEQVLALRWAYPEATQADLALLLGGITDRMVRNYLASQRHGQARGTDHPGGHPHGAAAAHHRHLRHGGRGMTNMQALLRDETTKENGHD